MKFRFIDSITSDVLFESYGKTLKELFENSAEAMFTVICDAKKVKKKNKIAITVNARNAKALLFSWLQELIAQVDIQEMFFSYFDIKEISDSSLKAEVYGEPISMEKGNTVVKAVTNYKFALEKTEKGYKAVVSLDI